MSRKIDFVVDSVEDLTQIRAQGLVFAKHMGFTGSAVTTIACVFSELSRFIIEHDRKGTISVERIMDDGIPAVQFSLTICGSSASAKATASADRPADDFIFPPGINRFRSVMDEVEFINPACVLMKKRLGKRISAHTCALG